MLILSNDGYQGDYAKSGDKKATLNIDHLSFYKSATDSVDFDNTLPISKG